MASTNKRYGYTMALWEKGDTCRSLFRQVADWKKANRLPSTSLWNSMVDPSWAPWPLRKLLQMVLPYRDADGDEWNLCHYWSNFEIADMDFFRSLEYRTLFEHLDSTGGFYFERWGDAPIHSLAAALFLKPSQVHHFADIGYVHENFQICPKNAPGGQLQRNLVLSDHRPWDTEQEGGVGCRCRCNPTKKVIRPFCNDALRRSVEP
jgi:mannosyltransferase